MYLVDAFVVPGYALCNLASRTGPHVPINERYPAGHHQVGTSFQPGKGPIYTFTLVYMIWHVIESGKADPGKILEFPGDLVTVMTTIGGLISALVISKLAITTPGGNPGFVQMAIRADGKPSIWITSLVWGYLSVWLLVGLSALVVGVMLYHRTSQTVHDVGTTWLGLAVASGFAYFGIEPTTAGRSPVTK